MSELRASQQGEYRSGGYLPKQFKSADDHLNHGPAEVEGRSTGREHARRLSAEIVYVDCNAVAPETSKQVAAAIAASKSGGGRVLSAGHRARTRHALLLLGVRGGICAPQRLWSRCPCDGREIGQASGLKMCYAALTKDAMALALERWSPPSAWAVGGAGGRWELSQAARYEGLQQSLPWCD